MFFKTTQNLTGKTTLKTNFGDIKNFFKRQDILSDSDISAIKAYNKEINSCTTSQTAFYRTMLNTSEAAQIIVEEANGNTVALNNMTRASKASELALKGLAMAGNMLAGLAIAEGISFVIKKISDFANSAEIAKENAKQYVQSINENLSSIGTNSSKLKSLNDELQILSKGVTDTGDNINLSVPEYDRYKEIISEISAIMPNLTTYFNAQGEKIGFVKGKLKDANKEYREYIQNQAQNSVTGEENKQAIKDAIAAYNSKDDKGIWSSAWNSFKAAWGFIDENSLETSKIVKGLEEIYNIPREETAKALEPLNIDPAFDAFKLPRVLAEMLDTSPAEIRKMTDEEFNVLQENIKANIDNLNSKTEADFSTIKQILLNFVFSSSDFSKIDDENIRNNITTFISSLTSEMFDQLDIEEDTAIVDIIKFINKIISYMSENDGNFSTIWENLFRLNPDKLNAKEYTSQIQEYISTLCNKLGINNSETQKQFAISLGFDIEPYQTSESAFKSKLDGVNDNIKSKVLEILSSNELKEAVNSNAIDWSKLVPDNFKGTTDEIAGIITSNIRRSIAENFEKTGNNGLISFSDAWNGLKNTTNSNYQNLIPDLLELSNSGTLTPETLKSVENYNQLLKKTGLTAEETVKKIYQLKDTDFTSILASMREGISSISGILTTKKNNISNKKTNTDGISADVFAVMPDELKKCTKEYQDFVNTLGDGLSSMDECQKAASSLATAYLNNNYFLEKLNDSNKNATISMLEEMGIANANQLVTQQLAIKKETLAIKSQIAADKTIDFSNAAWEAISSTDIYKSATEQAQQALQHLYIQENIFSNSDLSLSGKVNALKEYALATGQAALATEANAYAMKKAENSWNGSTKDMAENYGSAYLEFMKKHLPKLNINTVKVSSGNTGSNKSKQNYSSNNSKPASSKPQNTKREINWLERAIESTTYKIDFLKTKFENIFAVKNKKSLKKQISNKNTVNKRNANLSHQINENKKLEKIYTKSEKVYKHKAKNVKLNKKLKKLARNGQIKGNYNDLIKKYGEDTASKIEKYQNYYKKSHEARKSRQETKTQIRELKKQQHQNKADDANSRISMLNAQADNQSTAKGKKQYLENSVKWTKIYYNQQIKIAQLENDSVKAAQLKAEKSKALLDIEIQKHQNLQDEYDNYISLYSAKTENGKNAKDKEAYLKSQITYTKKFYNEQIKIAEAEKNTILQEQLRIEKQQELLSLQTQILQNYADEHNASAALAATQASTAISAKDKNMHEHAALENTIQEYKYLYQIARLKKDTTEMSKLEAEIQDIARNSAKAQMDNIATEYQHKLDEIDRKSKVINHQISLTETRNGFLTAEMYEETVKSGEEYLEMLKLEKSTLEENFKNVQSGSSQWYEMRDIIYSVDEAIQNTSESIAGNTQKIHEARLELDTLGRSVIDDINSEADFYEKILSYKDMFDNDTGIITEEGSSTLALHALKSTNSITQNNIIQKQIDGLDRDYISGKTDMAFNDYYEQRKKLTEQQKSYIENCYKEMDAIKELCSEGYEKQKTAMENLTDKYKKALQAEKSLNDYQNNITDKTENISSIKKQIASLKGNTTEEARAKMQKLTVQLKDAEKDLEETEYEKYISDQEEILGSLQEEFENFINTQLTDLENLVEKVINTMPADASVVNNTLNEIADMWGIKLSDALDASALSGSYSTIADKSSETASIASGIYYAITGNYEDINDKISCLSETAQNLLLWLKDNNFTKDVVDAINNIKFDITKDYTDIPSNTPNITDPDTNNTWNNGNKNEYLEKNIRSMINVIGKEVYGTDKAGNNWSDRMSTDGLSQMLYENTGKILDDEMILGLAQMLGVKTNGMTSGSINDALKSGGYNSGTYGALRNDIAAGLSKQLGWTKHTTLLKNTGYYESGIAKPLKTVPGMTGDNGWCVVQKGETILNLEQTELFHDVITRLPELREAIDLVPSAAQTQPYNTVTNNAGNINIGDMVFNIDGSNISDLDSLKMEIQHNGKFRDFMTDIVLGKVTGNNYAHMKY